jgi:hypothetical protein
MTEKAYSRAQGVHDRDDLSSGCSSPAVNTLAVDEIQQLLGVLTSDQRDGPHHALGPLLGAKLEVLDPHVVLAPRPTRQMSLEEVATALEKSPAATKRLQRRALGSRRRCLARGAARR